MKKKPFLLFEMLIALSLMGILLAFLFSFLAKSIQFEKKIAVLRTLSIERQSAQIQLQDLFLSIRKEGDSSPFYTLEGGKELCFSFDHGIDPDPSFSGLIEGKLWVDPQGNLKLLYGSSPLDPQAGCRVETILSQVSEVSWGFLASDTLLDLPKPLRKKQRWQKEWSQEVLGIPSQIRCEMKQKGSLLRFAFRLTEVQPIATWRNP